MLATYQPESKTEELFLKVLAYLHKNMKLSKNARLTIIHLCDTDQQMEAFTDWVFNHIPETGNIPYDEIDLMCVANDVHKGVPIRTLKADKP